MYQNSNESILSKAVADVENAFANQAGGFSRFPGVVPFVDLPSAERVYLSEWRDNLIAATDAGKVYRIGKGGGVEDVTGVPLSGGKRAIFTSTEDQLVAAAGGPILNLSSDKTRLLHGNAPNSTHVVFVDGYLIAIEPYSGRFQFCDPGAYETWNPLSVFTANGKSDDLTAVVVTPFRELLMAGPDSIEQYERLPNGDQPFSRRWTTGEGVQFPYTLVADKSGTYGINGRFEFVRFYGQVSQDQGADVDLVFESIDDWTEAWASEVSVQGQKFIVLQAPFATNKHGTKGVTMLLDYRARKWSHLYGWDDDVSAPTRWPVWSLQRKWGHIYAGVEGGIARLDASSYQVLGKAQSFLIRSAHVSKFGPSRIDDLRIRLQRGDGPYQGKEPRVAIRVNRDNLGFDQWQYEPLGRHGERTMVINFGGQGDANSWQFEIRVTDDVPVEFVGMEIYVERLRW
jgi:hypothetical protein